MHTPQISYKSKMEKKYTKEKPISVWRINESRDAIIRNLVLWGAHYFASWVVIFIVQKMCVFENFNIKLSTNESNLPFFQYHICKLCSKSRGVFYQYQYGMSSKLHLDIETVCQTRRQCAISRCPEHLKGRCNDNPLQEKTVSVV